MKKFILCLVLVFLVNIVAGRAVQKKDEHKAEKPAENQEDLAVKLINLIAWLMDFRC